MELPNTGKHCAHPNCNKLDFLPIKCGYCRKQYCSEHGSSSAHPCSGPAESSANASLIQTTSADPPLPPVTIYTKPARTGIKDVKAISKKTLTSKQKQALEALKGPSTKTKTKTTNNRAKQPLPPKIALMQLKSKAKGNSSMDMADRVYICVKFQDKALYLFENCRVVIGAVAMRVAKMFGLCLSSEAVCRLRVEGKSGCLPNNQSFENAIANGAWGFYSGCTLELITSS